MQALTRLGDLSESVKKEIREIRLFAGQIAYTEDKPCSNLLVVQSGSLRVYKRASDGRMFTLYRVFPGECCSLTLACIFNNTMFPAFIEAEDEVHGYTIPARYVRQWLCENPEWQAYFFRELTRNVTQLTDLTDNLVFNNMDSRIANLLCRRLTDKKIISTTHQSIANEVGTSREVVSRSLRLLESRGYIKLMRGKIEVTRLQDLQSFSCLH